LKVCALSVFVSVQQQKSCIEFCGVGLNTIYECKYMYVCLYIYVCISQEPRGVTTAWPASSLLLQDPQSASTAQQGRTSMSRGALHVSNVVRIPVLFLLPLS
jgi:hypothetical protein